MRRRGWSRLLPIAALLAAGGLTLLVARTSLVQQLELKTYDARFAVRGARSAPPGYLIVLIDEATEQAIPEPRIFWQPHFGALLRAAATGGARALGLDVFFAMPVERWAADADRQFAEAFMEANGSMPVVLAYHNLQPADPNIPVYMLASSLERMGYANVTLDPDGFVRRQELADRNGQPSLAARLAGVVTGDSHIERSADGRRLRVAGREAPIGWDGAMLIHYWGPAGSFPSVSMREVLAAAAANDTVRLKGWFDGKIVLAGTTDPTDVHATPFYGLGDSSQWGTPGVEVQASTLATVLEQRFLHAPRGWVMPVLVFAAAGIASLLIFQVRFSFALPLMAGVAVVYFFIAAAFQQRGLVLPVAAPVLALVFSGLGSYGLFAATEGRHRRLLQDVFGRYVAPELARELVTQGEIPLGGERLRITVMFSDIRGFTDYSQGRDPHVVVSDLNEHFGIMTEEILAHGGMLNKFLGDGIMALFGAPVPHSGDALRAVKASLRMVERNAEFNRRRQAKGLRPLVIGIGLHTGDAVVGTIGASQKMEYTAIGDTVNIASRIEGENKRFGSQLLISQATWDVVRDYVEASPMGPAHLKGVEEPVPLYLVTSIKGGAA